MTTITYPNGRQVTEQLNADEQVKSITDWLGNTTQFGYDPNSNLATTTFADSPVTVDTSSYNQADQLSQITSSQGQSTLLNISYTPNADGEITNADETSLPGTGANYGYNQLGQLDSYQGNAYSYDNADNPTQQNGTAGYQYDAANELTSSPTTGSSAATTYGYDDEGERTRTTPPSGFGAPTTYNYDQAGDLSSVTRSAAGSAPAVSDSYGYDGDGLRQSESQSATTAQLTWDVSGSLPLLLQDGSISFIDGPDGLPIEQIDGSGNVLYYHHDQQGSTRTLTDASGKVVATFTYDPDGNLAGSTGSITTPLGYDGQLTDAILASSIFGRASTTLQPASSLRATRSTRKRGRPMRTRATIPLTWTTRPDCFLASPSAPRGLLLSSPAEQGSLMA